jgi:hypothetical protein
VKLLRPPSQIPPPHPPSLSLYECINAYICMYAPRRFEFRSVTFDSAPRLSVSVCVSVSV